MQKPSLIVRLAAHVLICHDIINVGDNRFQGVGDIRVNLEFDKMAAAAVCTGGFLLVVILLLQRVWDKE